MSTQPHPKARAARYGFRRARLEDDEARRAVEQALAALIGEPVALRVVLAERESPAASSQAGEVQADAGLPPELADDPLVRASDH